jgi:serine/threonine-protein kinase
MTDDRWQRVKAMFQAAVERPPGERTAFWPPRPAMTINCVAKSNRSSPPIPATRRLDRLPVAAAAVHLTPPRRVGPYEIVRLIGAGSMGEVYCARDSKLNRDIALKILSPLLALDPDRVARFTREAQVLAALNHPHIAAIYGLEESGDVTALVLELVDGPTLADRIALARYRFARPSRSDARSPRRSRRTRERHHPSRPQTGERESWRQRRCQGPRLRAR